LDGRERNGEGDPVNLPIYAFPNTPEHGNNLGMTLRDWFAGQALAGMLVNGFAPSQTAPQGKGNFDFTKAAYFLADAMLVEREKGE
jgi:hypothetical protein